MKENDKTLLLYNAAKSIALVSAAFAVIRFQMRCKSLEIESGTKRPR